MRDGARRVGGVGGIARALRISVWTATGRAGSVGRVEGELQRVVGRNVRRIRSQRGVSQEALAVELDVHRTYMGAVERGERNLTLRTVERLAAGLGVVPSELLRDPAPR